MIPQAELDALRARANIVSIIGQHVQLRKDGREFVGCCPFHQERTASFKVDPVKNGGVYICFGCGAKGDVFRFVSLIEGVDFTKAVARVRELAGDAPPPPRQGQTVRQFRAAPPPPPPQARSRPGPIVATYSYLDEQGRVLFEVCRHEPGEDGKPKTFRQRVPIPGGYNYSTKGIRRVLYRLPQVLAANEVWLCEGEKDVHTLERQGLTATTAAGGAKAPWLPEYSAALAGKDIIIVPDNDEPGRARGELIARELAGKAERVTLITLPGPHKDVTDFVEAGNSAHDLRRLAEERRASAPVAEDPSYAPLEAGDELPPNDIGRLIIRDHVIVADQMGYIFEYNHRFWEHTTREQIAAYAMAYDTHRHTKARRRNEAADYVLRYCHKREIRWRSIPMYEVPVWNGVVNLETGTLRKHRREDYLECVPPIAWTGNKPCHTWLDALKLYWGEDPDYEAKVTALQEFFGYCLMMHARYKKALVLFGESDTGKSQIAHVIRMLVGDRNTCAVPVEDMDKARERAPLVGKALNVLTELTSKSVVADGGFKTLVSTEEPLMIDPKHKQPIMYAPIAKHVIVCNSLPRVNDLSRGTFNRMLILKFNKVLPAAVQNRDIMDQFKLEAEGTLNWAIAGARRLFEQGGQFTRVPESDALINEYREEQNPVNDFIAECCGEVNPADSCPVLLSDFAERFSKWAQKPMSNQAVGSMLRSAGIKVEKFRTRGLYYDKRVVIGLEFTQN